MISRTTDTKWDNKEIRKLMQITLDKSIDSQWKNN